MGQIRCIDRWMMMDGWMDGQMKREIDEVERQIKYLPRLDLLRFNQIGRRQIDTFDLEPKRPLFQMVQAAFQASTPCVHFSIPTLPHVCMGTTVQYGMKYTQILAGWWFLYELQPKFAVMESSVRGISIFGKLSWGMENDNTLFKKQ